MTPLVADASAIVDILAGAPGAAAARPVLAEHAELHVPEHFRVEAISALRRLALRGDLSPERADRALDLLCDLRTVKHPVAPLTRAIWRMRDRLTAYDAAYLAIAHAIDARLLTTDAGLAAAAREDGRLAEAG
jgi:predicted nucleic acid-binding protein